METLAYPSTPSHMHVPTMGLLPSALSTVTPPPTKKRPLQEATAHNVPLVLSPIPILGKITRPGDSLDAFTPPDSRKKVRPESQRSYSSSKESEQVWPEDVENAFMEAIRKIPILGRRKIVVDKKPCGRNELIADYIYRRTGKLRTRKQVSSHIQVLKHLRRDDSESLVTDNTSNMSSQDSDEYLTLPSSSRRSSNAPTMNKEMVYGQSQAYSVPVSPLFAPNLNQFTPNASGLDVSEFFIWNGIQNEAIHHVYSQRDPQEDIFRGRVDSSNLPGWETRWPHLAECINTEGSINCGVVLVKARLALPPLELPLEPNDLKTHLAVTLQEPCIDEVNVVTRIYTMGQKVLELTNPVPQEQGGKLYIPFAQEFWVAFLQGLRNLEQDSEKRRIRESKTVIGGVTLIQELWAQDRRLGLLCWEFGLDEDLKNSVTVRQWVMPQTQNYFTPFISPAPSYPVFHSSPLAAYNQSTHLHPYAATLQRYSVSPMPSLEQGSSPLMMRPASAPIGFNSGFAASEIVDTGVVVPSMDPHQASGLGITGLDEENPWLDYGSASRRGEWETA